MTVSFLSLRGAQFAAGVQYVNLLFQVFNLFLKEFVDVSQCGGI